MNLTKELTISGVAGGNGNGVARVDDLTLFIPGVVTGDIVVVEYRKRGKKRWSNGKVIEFIAPSEFRRDVPCPHRFDTKKDLNGKGCGGCPLMALASEKQREEKLAVVERAFRQAHIYISKPWNIISSVSDLGYRDRIRMRFDNSVCGFNRVGSNAIEDIDSCPVSSFSEEFANIRSLISEAGQGEISVTSSHSKNLLLNVTSNFKKPLISPNTLFHNSSIVGFRWNKKYYGEHYINISPSDEEPFFVGPGGFSQAGRQSNRILQSILKDFIEALNFSGEISELYAGSGNLTRILSDYGEVTAYEADPNAKMAFEKNLQGRALFKSTKTEYVDTFGHPELMVLDPPRTGISSKVLKKIVETDPQYIILYSCDPMTGMRDLRGFLNAGWKITDFKIVDTMPNTIHMEIVTLLSK